MFEVGKRLTGLGFDAILDEFKIGVTSDVNVISTPQVGVNGTSGEKVRVTLFVG